ncbi:MAG: EpsI family protein [Desulfovibrionales bacterium]|nr:MAG: EpsI family protein [Desulfovibrionales bacterium]
MLTTKRFILVYALLLLGVLYMQVHAGITPPVNKPFVQFPERHLEWRLVNEFAFSERVMEILKPTDILNRTYIGDDLRPVDLHIGFYDGGKGTGVIHSPRHCLPGGGWQEVFSNRIILDLDGTQLNVVEAVYEFGPSRELFLYWFQSRDKTINSEFGLKLAEITSSMFHGRRDTAFIRISTRYEGDLEQARERARAFAMDFSPVIREFLPS